MLPNPGNPIVGVPPALEGEAQDGKHEPDEHAALGPMS